MTTTNYLKDEIFEYISKNNEKLDSVDITNHFKLRVDITLTEVKNLEEEGKIKKVSNGVRFVYEVVR